MPRSETHAGLKLLGSESQPSSQFPKKEFDLAIAVRHKTQAHKDESLLSIARVWLLPQGSASRVLDWGFCEISWQGTATTRKHPVKKMVQTMCLPASAAGKV